MQECFVGGENRLRYYMMGYNIRDCPLRTFLIYSWLVIENATEADAELVYSCQAGFTASNPIPHYVSRTVDHSLTPGEFRRLEAVTIASSAFYFLLLLVIIVYPSLEIIPLEMPTLQPGTASTYYLKPDETLELRCSVQAGEGDRLVWLLNGTVIPTTSLDIDSQQVCKI